MKLCASLMMALLAGLIGVATGQETIEFEGPDNARIYVLEGDFKQSSSAPVNGATWYTETDLQSTMEVNSGAMTWVGSLAARATLSEGLVSMNLSLAAKGVAKQAGAAVRWNATAAMSGPVSVQLFGYAAETVYVVGAFRYSNMTLDEATGEQTGTTSFQAKATDSYGRKFPLSQPPTFTTLPRPTIYASEGEWRNAAGDWSSEIVADVYPNGKIAGTGELIIGDATDPYANVDQNVKGKLNSKTGVVSLRGAGTNKGTSKVKVTLNYVNSTGDTITGKSSVNAYAQKRKF